MDRFANDPFEWNDSDEDGLGDNSDYCPEEQGNASLGIGIDTDSDGDGWADIEDIWPNDTKAGRMEMETCSQTSQVLHSVMIVQVKMVQATFP